ncbi:MAG: rhodanese-like domain-containing protein [Myxococcales bacterium]|nr:rhodanese-like domain-containing protein [Myxococcales bacterium]MCB9533971.1 rhodanese-like domain-containing protein [Myxococcales bacterium]
MDLSQPLVWVAVAAAAVFAIGRLTRGPRVASADARALVRDGATLLDVRSPAEFSSGHVDGAKNIPVGDLARRLPELDRARPVVVYCRSGARSAAATRILRSAGFDKVHDLGPMSAW